MVPRIPANPDITPIHRSKADWSKPGCTDAPPTVTGEREWGKTTQPEKKGREYIFFTSKAPVAVKQAQSYKKNCLVQYSWYCIVHELTMEYLTTKVQLNILVYCKVYSIQN
jgi:hypothetical protein